jgi:hypothetical protein
MDDVEEITESDYMAKGEVERQKSVVRMKKLRMKK